MGNLEHGNYIRGWVKEAGLDVFRTNWLTGLVVMMISFGGPQGSDLLK